MLHERVLLQSLLLEVIGWERFPKLTKEVEKNNAATAFIIAPGICRHGEMDGTHTA